PSGWIPNRKGAIVNPTHRAAWAHDTIFLVVITLRLFGQRRLKNVLTVFGMKGFHPVTGRGVKAGTSAPPNFLVAGADVQNLVLSHVRHPKNLADGFGDLPEPSLTLAQFRL